jgi:glycosyltransferase involved in cell wall biosynthesis
MNSKNDQKHVVVINKAYPPWIGGIEKHVRDTCEAIQKRGWRVTALVCNNANYESIDYMNGVQVIRIPRVASLYSQPIVRGYIKRVKQLKPDILHVHVPYPLGWFTAGAVASSIPVICTWHSDIIRQRWLEPLYHKIQKRFLNRCNRILVTSEELLAHSSVLRKYQEKCAVNHLAIPDISLEPTRDEIELINQIKADSHTKIILYVGRLVGYKGLVYLLKAMQEIDAVLVIAGDGPLRSQLQALASVANLQHKIRFLGNVSESLKTALYTMADLFVLPSISRNEAFGYVLLEAMQQGCPIVSTDLPTGVRIVNQHNETGLIVPPKNASALRDAISSILSDSELHQRFSLNAKKRVETEFNFSTMIDRIESTYQNFL